MKPALMIIDMQKEFYRGGTFAQSTQRRKVLAADKRGVREIGKTFISSR